LSVSQCLRLLGGLTAVRRPPDELLPGKVWPSVAPNAAAVVLEMQATSMVSARSHDNIADNNTILAHMFGG